MEADRDENEQDMSVEDADDSQGETEGPQLVQLSAEQDAEDTSDMLPDPHSPTKSVTEEDGLAVVQDNDTSDSTDSSDGDPLEERSTSTANKAFLPHRDRLLCKPDELGGRGRTLRQMDAGAIRHRVKQSIGKKRKQLHRPVRTKRDSKLKTEKKRMQRESAKAMQDW